MQEVAVARGPGKEVGEAAAQAAAVIARHGGPARAGDASARRAAEQSEEAGHGAWGWSQGDVVAPHGDDEDVVWSNMVASKTIVLFEAMKVRS